MKLKEGMLLFHGSYAPVEAIDLSLCESGKDFGRGFYLTSDFNQAKSFVRTSLIKAKKRGLVPEDRDYGFVSSFRFIKIDHDVKVHEFVGTDKEWLWFISMNRRAQLAERLNVLVDSSICQSDVIIGKIANDTTNPVIAAYLNGLYGDVMSDRAVQIAIEQLMPDRLKDQFCFLSEKAISCLNPQEVRKYVN